MISRRSHILARSIPDPIPTASFPLAARGLVRSTTYSTLAPASLFLTQRRPRPSLPTTSISSTMARASSSSAPRQPTKTVVVLGVSYGGARAAKVLAEQLPTGWRVVSIDRNSHMNHVYAFPRFTILPQHAPKGFIPYLNLFAKPEDKDESTSTDDAAESSSAPASRLPTPPLTPTSSRSSFDSSDEHESDKHANQFIQGNITSLTAHTVTFTRPDLARNSYSDISEAATPAKQSESIDFDYCVYALGSGMPDPVNVWGEHPNMPAGVVHDHRERGLGSKIGGIQWMERKAEQLKCAKRIVIVGGGALGIQFATDLMEVYPNKKVTLLHSRTRLLPLYPLEMHVAVLEGLKKQGVDVVLGERVMTWPEEPENLDGTVKVVRTDKGRQFEADLVLPCTGQKPHVSLIASVAPSCISPTTNRIRVLPSLQVHQGPIRPTRSVSRATTEDRLASLTLHAPSPPASDASASGSAGSDDEPDLSHIFAVGDCAETGAIQAGHTAYYQADLAARNILRLIDESEGVKTESLESYEPTPPAIKVSLGLKDYVSATAEGVKVAQDGVEDLQSLVMWPLFNAQGLDVMA